MTFCIYIFVLNSKIYIERAYNKQKRHEEKVRVRVYKVVTELKWWYWW